MAGKYPQTDHSEEAYAHRNQAYRTYLYISSGLKDGSIIYFDEVGPYLYRLMIEAGFSLPARQHTMGWLKEVQNGNTN
jgi:hypothetical protein